MAAKEKIATVVQGSSARGCMIHGVLDETGRSHGKMHAAGCRLNLINTCSVPNYNLSNIFDFKFDHSLIQIVKFKLFLKTFINKTSHNNSHF